MILIWGLEKFVFYRVEIQDLVSSVFLLCFICFSFFNLLPGYLFRINFLGCMCEFILRVHLDFFFCIVLNICSSCNNTCRKYYIQSGVVLVSFCVMWILEGFPSVVIFVIC